MTVYVYRDGEIVDKALVYGPHNPTIQVITDEMPLTRHMCDNKLYTSKQKFREITKAFGCLEVGNDPAILRPRKPIPLSREKRRDDIRRTLYELRNGRGL